MKPLKWSAEWIAAATDNALLVAYDVAKGNALFCGENKGAISKSFMWNGRADRVKAELDRRGVKP